MCYLLAYEKFDFLLNAFIKIVCLLCVLKSLSILYGHDGSKTFSRSKMTEAWCLFLINASRIKVSMRTARAVVLSLDQKPVCRFKRRFFLFKEPCQF